MYEYQLGVSTSVGIFAHIKKHIYFVPVMKYRLFAGKSSQLEELGFTSSKTLVLDSFILQLLFLWIVGFTNVTKCTCSEFLGNPASL